MTGSAPRDTAPTPVLSTVQGAGSPPPPAPPTTASALELLTLITARWGELGQHLLRLGAPLLAAAITEAKPVGISGDQLTITAPANRVPLLLDPEQARVIAGACMALFSQRLRLMVKGTAQSGNPLQTGVTDERSRRYQAAQEHPVVRDLMQRFEADLVGRELIVLETWLARLIAERDQAPRRRFQGDLNETADG